MSQQPAVIRKGRLGPVQATGLLIGVVIIVLTVPKVGPVTFAVLLVALMLGVTLFQSPVACLMVPILVAPVALRDLPGTPGMQVIHIAVLIAVGGVLVSAITGRLQFDPAPSLIWGGLFIAFILISTMMSADPMTSVKVALNHAFGFALGLSAALVARSSRRSLRLILRGWTLAAIVVLVPALPAAMEASDKFGGTLVEGRVQGVFAQPNDFAEFALMGLTVAWALLAGARTGVDRGLGGVGIVVAVAGIAVSFSRGAWIATGAMVLIAMLLAPRLIKWVLGLMGAALGIAVLAVLAGIPPFPALLLRLQALLGGAKNPEDDRPLIWVQGLRIFSQEFWFGRGPGTFSTGSDDLGSDLIQRHYIHAHNVLLTVASEFGVLALMSLLALTVAVGVSCLRALSRLKRAGRYKEAGEVAVLGAGLAGVAIHGIVDVVYTNPFLIPLAWLLLGILAGACRRALRETSPEDVAFGAAADLQCAGT